MVPVPNYLGSTEARGMLESDTGGIIMPGLRQDLIYGLRMMCKNPGVSLVILATMGLGIGLNTAVFSVVNSLLLRPLPYANASRLVELSERTAQTADIAVVYPNFLDWQQQNTVFSDMAVYLVFHFSLHTQEGTERVPVGMVSADFFRLFSVVPTKGRSFRAEDDRASAPPAVIVTDRFWKEHMGSDPDLLNKTVTLNDHGYSVVGILPPQFRFYQPADVFIPYGQIVEPFGMMDRANHNGTMALARLKPGASLKAARTQMEAISLRLERQYPDTNSGSRVNVTPLQDRLASGSRSAALLLLGSVALVLLIACVNIANLMLARAEKRQREIAVRISLGATRKRIISQLLVESLLLAFLGGVLGLLCGLWGFEVLKPLLPWQLTQLQPNVSQLDFRLLIFAFVVTLLAGSLFGLVPALEVSRPDLQQTLRATQVGLSARLGRYRVSHLLVAAEVALALMLLSGAGLLLHSFQRLTRVQPGFDADRVLALRVASPIFQFREDPLRIADFYQQILDGVKGLPGVEEVGATTVLPFTGETSALDFYWEGKTMPAQGKFPLVDYHVVSTGYFRAMGIPLLRGSLFDPMAMRPAFRKGPLDMESFVTAYKNLDVEGLISESLARLYWPEGDAVGKRLRLGRPEMHMPWVRVVGIVGNTTQKGLEAGVNTELYLSMRQYVPNLDMNLVVRTENKPVEIIPTLRTRLRSLVKDQPFYDFATMQQRVEESIAGRRFNQNLLLVFGLCALLLTIVGLYGVVAYSVSRQQKEIGIRMAIGAQPRQVSLAVLRQGLLLVVSGIIPGMAGAIVGSRLIASQLYATRPIEPSVLLGAVLLIGLVASLACYLPARRAARVDPLQVLRSE